MTSPAFSNAAPLAADAPEQCVYMTGVSKAVAPGLRVGFVRAPEALVSRLAAAVFASTVMAPAFGTEIVGRWLADGLAARVIAWKRSEFQARATFARQVLGLRDGAALSPHLWLPTGGSAPSSSWSSCASAACSSAPARASQSRRRRAAGRARLPRAAAHPRSAGARARRRQRGPGAPADAARERGLTPGPGGGRVGFSEPSPGCQSTT